MNIQIKIYYYKVKDRSIKNHTYYFFNDIINIKNFDLNNIKIVEKSYKNILIYYVQFVTINDLKYVKIGIVNSLCLIFSKGNKYFEEINKNKYLMLVPTNKSKEIIKNMKNCGVKSEIMMKNI